MQLKSSYLEVNALVQIQSALKSKKMRECFQMHTVVQLRICILTEQEKLFLGSFTY